MKTMRERFAAKVSPEPMSGCWLWLGKVYPGTGYGGFHLYGRETSAHRASWELTHGSIPEGLHVLHRCDNRVCVNPAHLFLGTNADNIRDMFKKGRAAPQVHPESYRRPRPGARGPRKPPAPCCICDRTCTRRQLSNGRCRACDEYRRLHGRERPLELIQRHRALLSRRAAEKEARCTR